MPPPPHSQDDHRARHSNPTAAAPSLLSPRFLFVSLSLLLLLAFTLSPRARGLLGIMDHGRWFLDSYAVLASSDAHQAGIDADAPNPLDVLRRSHKYSDWWFALGKIGLTRKDNFLVGSVWVLAFLAAVFFTVKPSSRAEAVWLSFLLGSPPVFLGILRANNDLVIFAVLALMLGALRSASAWRIVLATAALALATGLKFYPAAAGIVFLAVTPPRRMLVAGVAAIAALVVVGVFVGAQMWRGTFHIEPEIYTFGGRILLLDFGWTERLAVIFPGFALVLLSLVAVRYGWTRGLVDAKTAPEAQRVMLTGAALLVLCFSSAVNYGYRWIFALWVAPWLWANRGRSRAARIAVWLLPVCLWHDGFLCLATALWFPNLKPEQYDRILVLWRWATEPAAWCLLIFLSGWLMEMVLARSGEVRRLLGAAKR